MLRVSNLVVDIQGSRVLHSVSFEVHAGELVCLVGRNGAGKTTSFRTVMGFYKPVNGTIQFEGRDVIGHRPHQMAKLGIGYAPEESEVFGDLSVAENIAMPTWTCPGGRNAQARIDEAYRIFPQLERYRGRGGHALSGGERKMVSIARALALDPKLLLLDEPTEGLSRAIVPSIIDALPAYERLVTPFLSRSPMPTTSRMRRTVSTLSSEAKSYSPAVRRQPAEMQRWFALSKERLALRPRKADCTKERLCNRCVIHQTGLRLRRKERFAADCQET